jgi:subtilisin family serine protease
MILSAPRVRRLLTLSAVLLLGAVPIAQAAGAPHGAAHVHRTPPPHVMTGRAGSFVKNYKLDDEVGRRAIGNPLHTSRVIIELVPGAAIPPQFKAFVRGDKLDIINGHVLELPNRVLAQLAAHPAVFRVHEDRDTFTHNYRTAWTVGATTVVQTMGLTGRGVGVAVIDSGITPYHDDLTAGASATLYPYGNQRVAKFVDFVNGRALPYDDNGHGSHVAGTILGNGADSSGQKAGMAPGASLVSLKVLDLNGQGKISNILAALNWVALNAATYQIRVVNLSVGAAVKESFLTDPLTLAAKALTDRGIVVVAAAGNLGKNAAGLAQYGGITAPGNAPWVLTVGASSTQGTPSRADDIMGAYSSRGPTYLDWSAKPDLVAPGTGTMSLAVPGSTFYSSKAPYLVKGSNGQLVYLALTGTSMAAPVVSGTVALMLQANPALTPNLVKGILQYTAQTYPGYNVLTQGAGFLNTLGAVRLARFYATARAGDRMPTQKIWSRHLIWGNHLLTGGIPVPSKNAWGLGVVWGSAKTLGTDGDNIIWGTAGDGDNIIWGTADGDNIIWGTDTLDNIIWGTDTLDNIIWGTSLDLSSNIIWGTAGDGDNIIWGTECGGADCDKVAWGTADLDNIIWGTANDGDNIIWGTSLDANIVWGTAAGGEDVTWGSSASDAVTFPDDATVPIPSLVNEFGDVTPVVDVVPVGGV